MKTIAKISKVSVSLFHDGTDNRCIGVVRGQPTEIEILAGRFLITAYEQENISACFWADTIEKGE